MRKEKRLSLSRVSYTQELSAYGAAAVLRKYGFSAANGDGLAKVNAPRRNGHFTTSYVCREIVDWASGVVRQYHKMAVGSLPREYRREWVEQRRSEPHALPVTGLINTAWTPGGDIIRKMR